MSISSYLPHVNKTFLKGVFWLLVLVFLASIFNSAGSVYDRIIQKPEVRKFVLPIGQDITSDGEYRLLRAIVVHNRGNADAKDVRIFCSFPQGEINRLVVLSEENYSVNGEGPASTCDFRLERLSTNSKFVAVVFASTSGSIQDTDSLLELPFISATYDGGTAVESTEPTSFEEMQEVGSILASGTTEVLTQLDHRLEIDEAAYGLVTENMPKWGIRYEGIATTESGGFRKAIWAAIILAIVSWLLLRRLWAGLAIAGIFSLLVWLYLDIRVDSIWMVIPLSIGIWAWFTSNSRGEKMSLVLFFLVIVLSLVYSTSLGDWKCIFTNGTHPEQMFNCYGSTVSIVYWTGATVFSTYLSFVDL